MTKSRYDEMSGWMREFADYWKDAEGRIKKADYVSNVQRVLNNKRTVNDVIDDLKSRVGLDLIEDIKKESEAGDVSKTASNEEEANMKQNLPEALRENSELLERLTAYIQAHPFVSFMALSQMDQFNDPLLDDPQVEKYIQGIIENAREGKSQREENTNFVVDHIDSADNKYLDYNEDRTNKI